MHLDPKARQSAIEAANEIAIDGAPVPDYVDAILRSYLSSAIPGEVADLVERLRSRASNHAHRPTRELCSEAATAVASLAARVEALEAGLERIIAAPLIDHTNRDNNPASIARLLLKKDSKA